MTSKEIEQISKKVNEELDKAEAIWHKVRDKMFTKSLVYEHFESNIPGFPNITHEPEVAEFIAFILDIRGSSKHLMEAVSIKKAAVSQLERLHYETTALFTACAMVLERHNGFITEYLGDGFLALFNADELKNPHGDAFHAAINCIAITKNLVNNIIQKRYRLEPLVIGIGLAKSPAIVTLVGINTNLHPKAIGECIYRASKLSKGINEIFADKRLRLSWPKGKGTVQFSKEIVTKDKISAYKLTKKK